MPRARLDHTLTELLGSAAAQVLDRWAAMAGVSFECAQILVNGRSSATVAAVFERGPDEIARKLILKHDRIDGEAPELAEYARQDRALREAPGDFGRSRLAQLAHEPVPVGGGSAITFQAALDGGFDTLHVLTSLLAGEPSAAVAGLTVEPVNCDRATFVRVCHTVVDSVLTQWAVAPKLSSMSASEFVGQHLEERAGPTKPLAALAQGWPDRSILLPGEARLLPNPFAFVYGGLAPALDIRIPALLGRAHGDLHTENILASLDQQTFKLIDLPRYRSDAPLTRDPVHLVLSIINRIMDELSELQREVLLEALAGPPAQARWSLLPGWLAELLQDVRDCGLRFAAQFNLSHEWRTVTPLSTLAAALTVMARPRTTKATRDWLLRLAARSAEAFARSIPVNGADDRPTGPTGLAGRAGLPAPIASGPEPPVDTGLGELCRNLPRKRALADRSNRRADLENLVRQANNDVDIRAAHARLMRDIGYVEEDARGLPSLGGGHPVLDELFSCPLPSPCGRWEQRGPHGETPRCGYGRRDMTASYD